MKLCWISVRVDEDCSILVVRRVIVEVVKSKIESADFVARRQFMLNIALSFVASLVHMVSIIFRKGSHASVRIGWNSSSLLAAVERDVSYVFAMAVSCESACRKKSGGDKSFGGVCC